MTITQKQRITIAKKKIRGIELTEEERRMDEQICGTTTLERMRVPSALTMRI